MKIKLKIILTVLPILVAAILITGIVSSFAARQGITRLTMRFLGFKSEEIARYAESQWSLLESNGLTDDEVYRETVKSSIELYAKSVVKSSTEFIFAVDKTGSIVIATDSIKPDAAESEALLPYSEKKHTGWIEFMFGGVRKVGYSFSFEPLSLFVVVSDNLESFYSEVNAIMYLNIISVGISVVVSIFLLLLFSSYITSPLTRVASAMDHVIRTRDLDKKVKIEYDDEIGDLAHTFNIMTGELEEAYRKIKEFAFRAVVAQKEEFKIRNIFQKFVPKELIETFSRNPESLLVGDNRNLAIMFSDIRNFTTTSEQFTPDELVTVLNRYFSSLVDIIVDRGGLVDKYIGDCIMAFFGAPLKHEDDPQRAVRTALEMQEAVAAFNRDMVKRGKPPFPTGIGINFGEVTVGNIGSEKKMDYTVIGDMVNLASRLEGLTKQYKLDFIFSRSIYDHVKNAFECRYLDRVVVKGKTRGEKIYTAVDKLTELEKRGWASYHAGLKNYFERDFMKAAGYFKKTLSFLPHDGPSRLMLSRCAGYLKAPPPPDWTGASVFHEK